MAGKRVDYLSKEGVEKAAVRLADIIGSMGRLTPGPHWHGMEREALAGHLNEAQHILAGIRRYWGELK